ncbi:hypothetical protein ONS95_008972 [Cadophora gregata]|uniref:uncharacterized protein n=1 Tax=Cadophora gregata TaxID=51156 RepID=UPI0026DACFD4|nr:uncharacterized protein ONS95_008972 [Cadophora gregata]KAK0123984.1 hypothetical protein ONS95_008972 [Cadophora gregata]KAK0130323.1 hypothetical protein ONS96_000844 [Cadophora gregata f. sp. sojae]
MSPKHSSSRTPKTSKQITPGSSFSSRSTTQAQAQYASSPAVSFLFVVNGTTLNDDPQEDGVVPRVDDYGRWLPPIYAAGFGRQNRGTVFRWSDGDISTASGYRWDDGYGKTPNDDTLELYKATTMVWCNPFYQFMVAAGDATTRNIADTVPGDTWYAINFHHEDALSRLDYVGNQYLAGNDRSFIRQLGLSAYENPDEDAPRSSGLAGNLAMLIGLVAFSCKRRDLDRVLLTERAWRGNRWHGHNHSHGRKETRGMVVSVYLDPDNPSGSTSAILNDLESRSGHLLK